MILIRVAQITEETVHPEAEYLNIIIWPKC